MADPTPNSQYNIASPDSLAVKIAGYQRRRMYDIFISQAGVNERDTILDVGVTSDRTYASSNYLEAWYPRKSAITAIGVDDAAFLEALYPGVKYVRASGLELPFRDRAFDVVHASAVFEHVGSAENQFLFLRESCRVASKAVFVTTPNRWFPMEVHTSLPIVHWLPKRMFRALMRTSGREFFAREENLNLTSAREIRAIAARVEGFDARISSVALGGWPSNLLLLMRRQAG